MSLGAASVMVVLWAAVPAFAAQGGDLASIPAPVQRWFDDTARADAARMVVPQDDDWREHWSRGAMLTLGPPSRRFTVVLPDYDLAAKSVTGPADLNSVLEPTDTYCGTLGIANSKIRGTICATHHKKKDTAKFLDGGTENFLPHTQILPHDGYIDIPLVGMFAFDRNTDTMTPLDTPAADAVGTKKPVKAAPLITEIARYLAEDHAIEEISGTPTGAMNLHPTAAQQEKREALVAQSLDKDHHTNPATTDTPPTPKPPATTPPTTTTDQTTITEPRPTTNHTLPILTTTIAVLALTALTIVLLHRPSRVE